MTLRFPYRRWGDLRLLTEAKEALDPRVRRLTRIALATLAGAEIRWARDRYVAAVRAARTG